MDKPVWSSPVVRIGAAAIQCHVVPRGGPVAEGIHVYQRQKLITAGGWLGLDVQVPPTSADGGHVAAVFVFLPVLLKGEWEVDLSNAMVVPSAEIAEKLVGFADDTIRRASLDEASK